MFPKGKYNTDISRNATYKVLFRSPGDRKQIQIMAEQTFAKDRPRFMQAYHQETDRPYGYIVVDNHPRTTNEDQVVGNVFGDCYTYPHITPAHPKLPRESLPPRELTEQQATSWKRHASVVEASKKRCDCYTYPTFAASPSLQPWQALLQQQQVQLATTRKRKAPVVTKPEVQAFQTPITSKKRRPRVQSTVKLHPPKKRPSRIFYPPREPDSEEEGSEEDMTSGVSEKEVDLSDNEGWSGESFHDRALRLSAPSDEEGHKLWTPRGIWS